MSTVRLMVGSAALCGMLATTGMAQRQAQQEKPKVDVDIRTPANQAPVQKNRSAIGRIDDKTTGSTFRASQLIGMNVYDAKGDELGEVQDLVLDGQSGTIRYAALSFGGFLGLGDKLFAIPWSSFEIRRDADDDDHHLVLNVSEQTLKNAPGFNEDQWPNFADTAITKSLDDHYGVRVRRGFRGDGVDVQVDPAQPNSTRRNN